MRVKAWARVNGTGVLLPHAVCQSAKWPKPLDFACDTCHYTCMRKAITRNQRKLLDGLCDRWSFDQQVELAGEIWPTQFKEIRRSFSRLQNLGFISWVSAHETSYEPRWFVTEKGVRYLLDN